MNKLFDKWVSTTTVMKVTLWVVIVLLLINIAGAFGLAGDEAYYEGESTFFFDVIYYGCYFLLGLIIVQYHNASKRLKEKINGSSK
jgi:hypothetical protein